MYSNFLRRGFDEVEFGAIHLNLPQGIWAFILGLFLHLAYLATRSLWVPMLLHFVNNAIAVIFQVTLAGSEPEVSWQAVLMAVSAVVVAIPCAWGLYRSREQAVVELA